MADGRIAVIISEIFDPLDYELLNGIYSQARKMKFDTVILTGIRDVRRTMYQELSSEKLDHVYSLVKYAEFDGVVYVADSFYDVNTEEKLFAMLEECGLPCVVIGRKRLGFTDVFPEQRSTFRDITNHLIKHHNCRSFGFLSGIKGEYNSEERYAGFLDALNEAGIRFDESKDLYFGNYWMQEPERIGKELAEDSSRMPDAIVCANDVMAAGLCDGLRSGGIKVPDDIKVTGYDGSWYALMHIPSVTTVTGCRFAVGAESVNKLFFMITGKQPLPHEGNPSVLYGRSCGCDTCPSGKKHGESMIEKGMFRLMERYMKYGKYFTGDAAEYVSHTDSLESLISTVTKTAYIMSDWIRFDICLCSDWMFDFEDPSVFRTEGFSENMHLISDKCRYGTDMDPCTFPVNDLLPFLSESHDPQLMVVTVLHSREQIFGYVVFNYYDVDLINYDAQFMNWNSAVANGFNMLQQKLYRKHIERQNNKLSDTDPITGFYNKRGFLECVSRRADEDLIIWCFGLYDEQDALTGKDYFRIISTSLRLTSKESEDISVIDSKMFVLIISDNSSSVDHTIFQRVLTFMREAERIRGFERNSKYPGILSKAIYLERSADKRAKKAENFVSASRHTLFTGKCDKLHSDLFWLRVMIWLHPESDMSVDEMAKRLNISRTYLHRIYKKEFGISAKEDVISARIEKAKDLLISTDTPVNEVSYHCGYSEPNHFMRQFRERTGITAAEYRKLNKNK